MNHNKKGSIQDIFLVLAVIFVFVVLAIVASIAMDGINDELQASNELSAGAKATFQEKTNSLPNVIDGILLIVLIGMGIITVFSATLLPTHPVFFIFTIVILAVIIGISAGITNAYMDFNDSPEVANVTSGMTVLPFVMTHFPKIMLFLGVLLFIGLYAKGRQDGGPL